MTSGSSRQADPTARYTSGTCFLPVLYHYTFGQLRRGRVILLRSPNRPDRKVPQPPPNIPSLSQIDSSAPPPGFCRARHQPGAAVPPLFGQLPRTAQYVRLGLPLLARSASLKTKTRFWPPSMDLSARGIQT